jgi:hypothetical protein
VNTYYLAVSPPTVPLRIRLSAGLLVACAAGCGGGVGHTSADPVPFVQSIARAATVTRADEAPLVDWPTYAYDAQRTGYNPSTSAFTPAAIPGLHLAWFASLGSGAQTQPVVATNVAGHAALVIVGAGNGNEVAYDGLTGDQVWSTYLGSQNDGACGTGGISGTAQYVASLGAVFAVSGNGGTPNHVVLYRMNAATGGITGRVDVTSLLPGESTYAHTGITYANGTLYFGTGSNCEAASWRGQVIAVDPNALTVTGRFFTTYGHGGPWGGGGVWSWGGVSVGPAGNVYVATGNAETPQTVDAGAVQAPFEAAPRENAGFAEHLVKLSSDLSHVLDAQAPAFDFALAYDDLDYSGTPVLFRPPGCGPLTATQGKGGKLVVNDADDLSRAHPTFQFSTPSALADYIGNPAYSPRTGYLYASIASATDALAPPGLAALGGCGDRIAWTSAFGPDSFAYASYGATPRSAPSVTAGGVVFLGTPCTPNGSGGCGTPGAPAGAVWAVDASDGTVLGGGSPVLLTGDVVRMAPVVDGSWMWVLDQSGNLYGSTIDPSVPAFAGRPAARSGLRELRFPG